MDNQNKDQKEVSLEQVIATSKMSGQSLSEQAEAIDKHMSDEMDKIAVKSVIYTSGERDPTLPIDILSALQGQAPGQKPKYFLMGHDPRLKKMPDQPTLADFFKYRFAPAAHLLQSAALAKKNNHEEKIILACLLHDISMVGFIRGDHGYWGAQLIAPYVDEEISWAVRAHQILRFYPDESVGYQYPEMYTRLLGPEFRPTPYMEEAYKQIRKHKWYMTARLITVNDLYAFDPSKAVKLEEFTDIIAKHFKQPKEGLGFDDTSSSHMWRTINWPTRIM